ncbi:C45 family peptidase [Cytophagaceae bacterium ABcell3]|nr:C45 family peptidase [Cytophagaceae bacterium ABcell3]
MRILKYLAWGLGATILLCLTIFYFSVRMVPPLPSSDDNISEDLERIDANQYRYGNNLLIKNHQGLWEIYLEGKPYQRGVAFGALAQHLMKEKESAFIGEIKNRIPSEKYLNFLKYLVAWFNRDLDKYVPEETLLEIYGAAAYMDDLFDYIAPKYHRSLSYHGAHDIGHALQNMNLVGCTSFATWGESSEDNKLLIGRNFDFYFGEPFSRDKIVAFYKPDSGYKFMSVTWAGFSGVVSGMNEKGLTITLNSAKSEIPTKGKTPVSLIARQILQYASNIEEAYTIASNYESFVAETFLIGSKADGKVGLIEKSPQNTALHFSDTTYMVITNHFQSKELFNDPLNQEYIDEEVSVYRYAKTEQLIDSLSPLNAKDAATILRDRSGIDNKNLGLGNEKAINQLIAHHGIIFAPEDLKVWVSCAPYQLGAFVTYDLNEVFDMSRSESPSSFQAADSLHIPADTFLLTKEYEQYEVFAKYRDLLQNFILAGKGDPFSEDELQAFENSNPNCFLTYYYLGNYYKTLKNWEKAKYFYEKGLTLEIARVSEKKHMEESLKLCLEKLNDQKNANS